MIVDPDIPRRHNFTEMAPKVVVQSRIGEEIEEGGEEKCYLANLRKTKDILVMQEASQNLTAPVLSLLKGPSIHQLACLRGFV